MSSSAVLTDVWQPIVAVLRKARRAHVTPEVLIVTLKK